MTECLLACMQNLPGVWCQFSVQLYSSMVILKLNPKFLPSSVVWFFFLLFPQNRHGLVAVQRHSAWERESINNFRRCKYSGELNGCFLSLEDEEIIKWGKSLIVFSLALFCSPFNFDRKIREHCFHFQWYLSNVACIDSLLVQTQLCARILKDGTSLGSDSRPVDKI